MSGAIPCFCGRAAQYAARVAVGGHPGQQQVQGLPLVGVRRREEVILQALHDCPQLEQRGVPLGRQRAWR